MVSNKKTDVKIVIYFVLAVLLLLITFLIFLLRRQEERGRDGNSRPPGRTKRPRARARSHARSRSRRQRNPEKREEPAGGKRCTICGGQLEQGRPLRTTLYPPDGGEGRLMEIHGCPACSPREGLPGNPEAVKKRKCPLCGSRLSREDVLICRRLEAPGRNQVLVLGCPKCYRRS